MRFEWDEAKNRMNEVKHGIRFEEAVEVFFDPDLVPVFDRVQDGEQRWHASVSCEEYDWCWSCIHLLKTAGQRSLGLFPRDGQTRRRQESMANKMVSDTVETLPPITDERLEEMKQYAAQGDNSIDYSDAPALTDAQLRHAFPGVLRRFFRTHLMTRVDADLLAWLRGKGTDHDLYVNDLLRRTMEQEKAEQKAA